MTTDFASIRASYARRLMFGDMTRSQYNHAILMLERAEQRARDREAREARKREVLERGRARRKLRRQLMRSLEVA